MFAQIGSEQNHRAVIGTVTRQDFPHRERRAKNPAGPRRGFLLARAREGKTMVEIDSSGPQQILDVAREEPAKRSPSLRFEADAAAPLSRSKQLLRKTIHFLSYHFILKRRRTTRTRVAGFRLTVGPTVFHPRCFLTSKFFASFLGGLELKGKRVADVGTGSGILALAAARAGAANVIAIDINPNATKCALENARDNALDPQVTAVASDLLSALRPGPIFDVILSSPPSFAGEPRDIADRAWHAGPHYRDLAALFQQASERLADGGLMYVLLSTDSDLKFLGNLISLAGFQSRIVARRSIVIEALLIYELRVIRGATRCQG
jgi:release factor glutamine methyltransferase